MTTLTIPEYRQDQLECSSGPFDSLRSLRVSDHDLLVVWLGQIWLLLHRFKRGVPLGRASLLNLARVSVELAEKQPQSQTFDF